jgi:hypothetical protein
LIETIQIESQQVEPGLDEISKIMLHEWIESKMLHGAWLVRGLWLLIEGSQPARSAKAWE